MTESDSVNRLFHHSLLRNKNTKCHEFGVKLPTSASSLLQTKQDIHDVAPVLPHVSHFQRIP